MAHPDATQCTADLFVKCLEQEGVRQVFGIPGEENILLVDAIERSETMEFIVTRHEQGAAFMANTYGRLAGEPGVCLATLGPGALNLVLPVADANVNTTPLVAISAQGGINRINKESHQIVDLNAVFRPITEWSGLVLSERAVPEMVRRAFSRAKRNRPGATFLAIPQDIEALPAPEGLSPLPTTPESRTVPVIDDIRHAVELIAHAQHPVILAGAGVARRHAERQLRELVELLDVPVATTFEGKGVFSDAHPNALGVVGFMRHDYENFAFDRADLIIAIGFSIQQFDPVKINPRGNTTILHINTFTEDTDAHYSTAANVVADIDASLDLLIEALRPLSLSYNTQPAKIREVRHEEYEKGISDDSFPLNPRRIVADTRAAMPEDGITLVDTGALKMWMARLYPTYLSNTCIIDNGLSTMGWALPGAIGAAYAKPDTQVLAVMGDGSFLMNVQEIETAVRYGLHLVILVWVDDSYGLIKWKMDMEIGRHSGVDFTNPDFPALAESFGAHGVEITAADQLLPALREAIEAEDGVHVIACPVDYSENMRLIAKLGDTQIDL